MLDVCYVTAAGRDEMWMRGRGEEYETKHVFDAVGLCVCVCVCVRSET